MVLFFLRRAETVAKDLESFSRWVLPLLLDGRGGGKRNRKAFFFFRTGSAD